MKKAAAKYASTALSGSARLFASILKPALHSPKLPKELRK